MPNNEHRTVDLIKITKIPRTYLTREEQRKPPETPDGGQDVTHSRYENFLSAMMYSDLSIGFRIQAINGLADLHYMTNLNKSTVLTSVFGSQFLGFELQNQVEPTFLGISQPVYVAAIRGIPKSTTYALDGFVETMVNSPSPSLYQVWAEPTKPGIVTRKFIEKRYSSALGRAQIQDSTESWLRGRETITRYDVDAIHTSKRLQAAYHRMTSARLLNCRVIVATWGHQHSKHELSLLLNTLKGTISHPDKNEQLQVEIHSGKRARKILHRALGMRSKIRGTALSPRDAIPYYMIPQREMGIIQGSTASFSTAGTDRIQAIEGIPFKQDHIALGTVYRSGKLGERQVLYLKVEHLRRHAAILGMTGTGKSSTKNRIVIDAWMNKIPSLLIEPVKLDTRNLLGAIDDLRIFTVGRETVTPYRLNPFLVEEGVPVQAHIDQLYFAFLAAWPLGGVLANHLRKVFVRTYMRNGWNLLTDDPGRPVSVQDFRDEAERYANELQYGSELRQDFRGAILTRANDLCDPARAAIFNTTENLPVSELLSRPTVIELGHIKDPEFKALMLNLILYKIEQYFGKLGPADELRSLILIDEAHRFLRELPVTLDMSEIAMSKRQVQDQLEDLTAEARSVGIGIIVLDQDPSELSRRVLKNCHTKIVHRLESPDDVHLAALLTGCDKDQQAHICDMTEGEAIVRGLGHSVPLNIQVFHDPLFTDGMKSNWSDAEVIERMKEFYADHPEFAKTPDIPQLDPPEIIVDRDLLALRVQVEDIVQSEGYRTNYLDCIESEDAEEINAVEELLVYYTTQVAVSDRSLTEVLDVFIETTNTVYGEPPYVMSYTILQRLLREYVESRQASSQRRDFREP